MQCIALVDSISQWHKTVDPPPEGQVFLYDLIGLGYIVFTCSFSLADEADQPLHLDEHPLESGLQCGLKPRQTYRVLRQLPEERQTFQAADPKKGSSKKGGAPPPVTKKK